MFEEMEKESQRSASSDFRPSHVSAQLSYGSPLDPVVLLFFLVLPGIRSPFSQPGVLGTLLPRGSKRAVRLNFLSLARSPLSCGTDSGSSIFSFFHRKSPRFPLRPQPLESIHSSLLRCLSIRP